jgi:hypothetical protein
MRTLHDLGVLSGNQGSCLTASYDNAELPHLTALLRLRGLPGLLENDSNTMGIPK